MIEHSFEHLLRGLLASTARRRESLPESVTERSSESESERERERERVSERDRKRGRETERDRKREKEKDRHPTTEALPAPALSLCKHARRERSPMVRVPSPVSFYLGSPIW